MENITVKAPNAPVIPISSVTDTPHSPRSVHKNETKNNQTQSGPAQNSSQPPFQAPPQAAPSAPPATFLDRVVQENRGLTPDDRNRFSTALYECDQFIKQSQAIGYKLNEEFGRLNNDRQSGALAKNVDGHIKFFRDLDPSAWDRYHALQRLQERWQYFPNQIEYVIGDNPYNAGVGSLVNIAEGMANSLTSWSKISNRDQKDILNIEAQQQIDFERNLRQFFDWANLTLQRIKQMRQSLDPNGVVQPIPSKAVAPAVGMFSSRRPVGEKSGTAGRFPLTAARAKTL